VQVGVSDRLLPDDLYRLAERVIAANAAAGRTVAVAESCTGGLVAAALTEIAGSSAVFDCGFVTYSNEAKEELLGVPADILETFGAVSVAVAWAMARGALQHSRADAAVAITGVAGPAGGSEQKPVGTVVFALARRDDAPDQAHAETRQLPADAGRAEIRRQAALIALELLLP
jgi:nicotinamide-nucleotide amidase